MTLISAHRTTSIKSYTVFVFGKKIQRIHHTYDRANKTPRCQSIMILFESLARIIMYLGEKTCFGDIRSRTVHGATVAPSNGSYHSTRIPSRTTPSRHSGTPLYRHTRATREKLLSAM
jgi:hypothetical protein